MRIVSVYNRYLHRGGEDEVFEAELRLLQRRGVEVLPVVVQTGVPKNAREAIALARDCLWSRRWYRRVRGLLQRTHPDVVHVHNLFPLISPSLYYACHDTGVPVVQTLHNYRLLCARGTLFKAGRQCEECLDWGKWRSVRYRCYRDSHLQSGLVSLMNHCHAVAGTWSHRVSLYVTLSDFARRLFIRSGLPSERVVVKRNFVSPDPGPGSRAGGYALYVGRLSQEKGVEVLLAAWRRLSLPVCLHLVGDGPLAGRVREEASRDPRIVVRGRLSREEVLQAMKAAAVLVFPSLWYEGCSLVILEAFACGVPVVAFRLGMMAEIIESGRMGFHARPGDPDSLAEQIEMAFGAPDQLAEMARFCRLEYETKYGEERGYAELMRVYDIARGRVPFTPPTHVPSDRVPGVEGYPEVQLEHARINRGAS